MTHPINDVSKTQTCLPIKTSTQLMTSIEYGKELATLFVNAKKEGWCPDYLTDQIYQLNKKNSCLAQEFGFPPDHPGIKEKFVTPWMEMKQTEKKENPIKEYFHCHKESLIKLYRDQAICGISIMGMGSKPNKYSKTSTVLSCKDIAQDYLDALSCLKELKP